MAWKKHIPHGSPENRFRKGRKKSTGYVNKPALDDTFRPKTVPVKCLPNAKTLTMVFTRLTKLAGCVSKQLYPVWCQMRLFSY